MYTRIQAGMVCAGLTVSLVCLVANPGRAFPGKPATKGAKPGNVAAGKKHYEAKKCEMCHAIAGKGGKSGPDLSKEGNKRDKAWLAAFLKDPRSKLPKGIMPPAQGSATELGDLAGYLASLK